LLFLVHLGKPIAFKKAKNIQPSKGPFNNYVDKMRVEGVKKCLFLSIFRV
jgi:hypothetical protein